MEVFLEREHDTTIPVSVQYEQKVNGKWNYLQRVEVNERQLENIKNIEDVEEVIEYVKQLVYAFNMWKW